MPWSAHALALANSENDRLVERQSGIQLDDAPESAEWQCRGCVLEGLACQEGVTLLLFVHVFLSGNIDRCGCHDKGGALFDNPPEIQIR